MPGLLIVNADDLGASEPATDRTIECFSAGAITSATAMVFMADAERAAHLVRDASLPVGLHLNVTQAYDSPAVPALAARRQDPVVRFMAHPLRRRIGFAPWLLDEMRGVIADQLDRFRELYGSEPTHLDGHNHAHLNPTVLACLPSGIAVRPPHDAGPGHRRLRSLRRLRQLALSRRHRTVDHFFSLTRLHPALRGTGLPRALELAGTDSVEIMVHANHGPTLDVLRSDEWGELLAGRPLGTYAQI